jgi:ABC-type lipoprotein release transport system permease subunit
VSVNASNRSRTPAARGPPSPGRIRFRQGQGPLGVLATAAYAGLRGWPVVVPVWASAGGVAATVVLGVVAGIYPAVRAPGLAPAAAVSRE